jgi:hypothetical protein
MTRLFLGRKKNRPLSKKVDDSDPPPSRIADDIRPSAGQERTAAPRLAPRRLHLLGMTQVAEPGSARAATHAEDQTRAINTQVCHQHQRSWPGRSPFFLFVGGNRGALLFRSGR